MTLGYICLFTSVPALITGKFHHRTASCFPASRVPWCDLQPLASVATQRISSYIQPPLTSRNTVFILWNFHPNSPLSQILPSTQQFLSSTSVSFPVLFPALLQPLPSRSFSELRTPFPETSLSFSCQPSPAFTSFVSCHFCFKLSSCLELCLLLLCCLVSPGKNLPV